MSDNVFDFRVDSALTLLVQASRTSPPLREAVATVELEVRRLTEERDAARAECQRLLTQFENAVDEDESWRVRAESAEAALAEAVSERDTARAALDEMLVLLSKHHQWQDTGFADLDECSICGITRQLPTQQEAPLSPEETK